MQYINKYRVISVVLKLHGERQLEKNVYKGSLEGQWYNTGKMEFISWNLKTVSFALIKPVNSEAPVVPTYTVGQAVGPWAGAAEWKQAQPRYWPKLVVSIFEANQSVTGFEAA